MGLHAVAYEWVERVGPLPAADIGDVNEDAPRGCQYLYSTDWRKRANGMPDGVYRLSERMLDCCSVSYSTYGDFRKILTRAMLGSSPEEVWDKPRRYAGRPFVELVDFADNEGFFGPRTSKTLAEDFTRPDYRDAFVAGCPEGHWHQLLVSIYDGFAAGFALAASQARGVVRFG